MNHPPYIIAKSNPRRLQVFENCIAHMRELFNDKQDIMVRLSDVVRSLDQNAKMWPMLEDFARQVLWPVNGEMQLIEKEDWKAILTAAFQHEARMAPGLRGGFVMLGARTSKFSRQVMRDFIEFLCAEGGDRGVKWSEKSKEHLRRYGDIDV